MWKMWKKLCGKGIITTLGFGKMEKKQRHMCHFASFISNIKEILIFMIYIDRIMCVIIFCIRKYILEGFFAKIAGMFMSR